MFGSNQGKSTFLQKKHQEKQKALEQQKIKNKVTLIQKQIRAYLIKQNILAEVDMAHNFKMHLLMNKPL